MRRSKRTMRKLTASAARTATVLSQPLALAGGDLVIDRAAGAIRNVSILTVGPAIGHGFEVDNVMLEQTRDSIRSKGSKGVKCRLTHPCEGFFGGGTDGIELMVGRVLAREINGGQLRGDVILGKYSANVPGKGNVRDYLLDIAEEDPASVGMSIAFEPAEFVTLPDNPQRSYGRVQDCLAVDFVGDPAANPGGLLTQPPPDAAPAAGNVRKGVSLMNPKLRTYLESIGLRQDAGLTDALRYLMALEGEQKDAADALLAEGDPPAPPAPAEDLVPAEGESEDDFIARFVADEAMTGKYPEPDAREARAREIYSAANAPAPPAPEGVPPMAADQSQIVLDADRARRQAIMTLAASEGIDSAYAQGLADRGVALVSARELITLAKARPPVPMGASAGEDRNVSTLGAAISDAVLMRAGRPPKKPHERVREFRGLSMLEMGRRFLDAFGIDSTGMGRMEVAKLLFSRKQMSARVGAVALDMGTSDFPYILQDALGKTLRQAYDLAPSTWALWARRATAPDFKEVKRAQLGSAPALLAMDEGAEYLYGKVGEGKEVYTLAKYGRGLAFTREMLINDDLSAFDRVAPGMGRMAKYIEDDIAYAILTANDDMADGVDLFNASHSNVTTGTLSVTALGAMRAVLRKQVGLTTTNAAGHEVTGPILNLPLRSLICPAALETLAEQLIASTVDPSKSNATPNPFTNKLGVVAEPRLDATSATVYYGATDNAICDTIEVCFLEDEPEPVVEETEDFDTDSRKYKVRHYVAAKAIDWRGLVRSTGA
ncbi:MAG TPA: hypothetical protein VFH53_04765 [Phycisphaerae bacterium]|nr:hypothetical protein [Phycisphaerae bacterium]